MNDNYTELERKSHSCSAFIGPRKKTKFGMLNLLRISCVANGISLIYYQRKLSNSCVSIVSSRFPLKSTQKSQVKVSTSDSLTRCSYNRSPAYNLGFASAIFLLMAQIIMSVGSGCFCCRKGPAPSRSKWIIALFCFIVSWFTFVVAFLVLLTGASLNDEHIEETTNAGSYFCYIVKPGVFSIGSVLSLFTVALGIVYYLCLSSSKQNTADTRTAAHQGGGIAMGQPQIPERVEDPVFVHEDTYMRRQFT